MAWSNSDWKKPLLQKQLQQKKYDYNFQMHPGTTSLYLEDMQAWEHHLVQRSNSTLLCSCFAGGETGALHKTDAMQK